MTKRTRFLILLVCSALFFVIAPWIVLYSLGYRIDFTNKKLVATGGIYVRALPQSLEVIIDDESNKTGIFSNSVFVQNLLPKPHTVTIKKEGYSDYQKTLEVKGNEVTKLENVVLFKKDVPFTVLAGEADYISLAPNQTTLLYAKTLGDFTDITVTNLTNSQTKTFQVASKTANIQQIIWSQDSNRIVVQAGVTYFLVNLSPATPQPTSPTYLAGARSIAFNPQNASEVFFIKNNDLFLASQTLPLIKNVAAYEKNNQTITWLSYDGFLYNYDINSKVSTPATTAVFAISPTTIYTLETKAQTLFLQGNDSIFTFNQDLQKFESIYSPVRTIKTSPDNQKILYCNEHEVGYAFLNKLQEKVLLNRFSEQVQDCDWVNNDYVVFSLGNSIVISEIDTRGNINTVTLPHQAQTLFYSQQDKKAYILSEGVVSASERLLP